MRLIDADRAAKDIMGYFERNDLSYMSEQELEYVKSIVSKFTEILADENCTPTIDAQLVKHGKWETISGSSNVFCSECGAAAEKYLANRYKGCPFCLCIMEGGTDDA